MKINFLGDIYLTSKVEIDKSLNLNNIILNLEAPFTNNGDPVKGKINLFMDPADFLATFKNNKILAVGLANNHIMDYGERAFEDTLSILKENNISFFGAGNKSNNFNNPVIIYEKVAVFGYSCKTTNAVFGDKSSNGSALFDLEAVIREIKNYKDKYYVIVSIHWGQEYYSFPKPTDVEKAQKLIDAGVDLIIGHHPHNLQSYEIYKDKYIFYSLGNGIFHDDIVDSKYDGENFTRKNKMKFNKSNRISIKVEFDAETKKITKQFLRYNSKKLFGHTSIYLDHRIKMILKDKSYKLYGFYKNKMLAVNYHLNKLLSGKE